jgi:hypothetical protein
MVISRPANDLPRPPSDTSSYVQLTAIGGSPHNRHVSSRLLQSISNTSLDASPFRTDDRRSTKFGRDYR